MTDATHSNGYVRLTTLMAVGVPTLTIFAGAIAIFVNMSVAPMQRDIDQNKADIKGIQTDLVPRKEHDRDWASQDQRFNDLERQITDNKTHIEAIYTPGDAIKDLHLRIDQLEAEIHERDKKQ